MTTATATITVHDDATPSAHYPDDEQQANGAVDLSVTIAVGPQTSHHCDVCGVDVDAEGEGCDCDEPSVKISTIVLPATEITGELTLYRDDANGGGLGTCGTPLDGWCSGTIVAWLRRLDEPSRRTAIASLSGGVGTEDVDVQYETAK